ncbi:N-acetylmannosamine-6-phosphate 2-epimerase [Streptomyces armeniacus]|uniref:N-acetylmannosamine-6-phosphate 2-epimerase n=1 Tax=Streptomyces armeniacus TaxID=83291 RepID=UPI001FE2611F|nr:putative N-acetylmannosamine-6-phosphate 2-epimerase [Streptomyces armeniacus]
MGTPEVLRRLRGKLIVSCQALPHEALHGSALMAAMARAVVEGGAAAVRCNSPEDITAVTETVPVPVIGLWKDGTDGVYITPGVAHAVAVAEAGAAVVAADATDRPRPDGSAFADLVAAAGRRGVPVLADVATVREGAAAVRAGAAAVSTTLSGYTPETAARGGPDAGPDMELLSALVAEVRVPVIAEGRIAEPGQVAEALDRGAWAVVVGGAITRPDQITRRFAAALRTDGADGAEDDAP